MRMLAWVVATAIGCGGGAAAPTFGPDAPTRPTPMAPMPGGGIGGGAIADAVLLTVMDPAEQPISGAQVEVGGITGTTDDMGRFLATGVTLVNGTVDIAVHATSYRAVIWDGVAGDVVQIDLAPIVEPTGTITGTLDLSAYGSTTAIGSVPALVYASAATAFEPQGTQNGSPCVADSHLSCSYSITTRTGEVALLALVSASVSAGQTVGIAAAHHVMVAAAKTTPDVPLVPVTPSATDNVERVSATTPALPFFNGSVTSFFSLDFAEDGILRVGSEMLPEDFATIPNPVKLGATLLYAGVAQNGDSSLTTADLQHLAAIALAPSGFSWIAAPAGIMPTRTGASWLLSSATPPGSVSFTSLSYQLGGVSLLDITVLDGRTQATIPALITLPTAALTVDLDEYIVDNFDPKSFQVATARAGITHLSQLIQPLP